MANDAKSSPQMYAVAALVLGTFFIGIPALIIWGVKKATPKEDNRNDNPSLEEKLRF